MSRLILSKEIDRLKAYFGLVFNLKSNVQSYRDHCIYHSAEAVDYAAYFNPKNHPSLSLLGKLVFTPILWTLATIWNVFLFTMVEIGWRIIMLTVLVAFGIFFFPCRWLFYVPNYKREDKFFNLTKKKTNLWQS